MSKILNCRMAKPDDLDIIYKIEHYTTNTRLDKFR